jgi:hypothetical protein
MIDAIWQGIVNVLNPGMLPWVFLAVIVGLIFEGDCDALFCKK